MNCIKVSRARPTHIIPPALRVVLNNTDFGATLMAWAAWYEGSTAKNELMYFIIKKKKFLKCWHIKNGVQD